MTVNTLDVHAMSGGDTVTNKKVVFMDIHGERGVVTEWLHIDYTGEWEVQLEAWAADKKGEWNITGGDGDDDDLNGLSPRIALNLVMIELYYVIPVAKIERSEAS